MIKTIILDDEIKGAKVLEHLLKPFPEIEIAAIVTNAAQGIELINKIKPQLILLDINMPQYDGFEVIDQINYKNFKVIFVTAHNEYALKAFNYCALDYLLKPVDIQLFNKSIMKVISQIEQNDFANSIQTLQHNLNTMKDPMHMKLCISNVSGFSVINVQDIIYCQADSCYTIFTMTNQKQIISSKTLSEYEAILDASMFLRIHRSYIINLDKIKEYHKGAGGTVIMENNEELEVSRRKKDDFMYRVAKIYGK